MFAAAAPALWLGLIGKSSATVKFAAQGSYHIQSKEETPGTLTATLGGVLTGTQYVAAVKGNGSAQVRVILRVQPFGRFVLVSGFADAAGVISAKSFKLPLPGPEGIKKLDVPRQAGSPQQFNTLLARRRAVVPCCTPQKFTVQMEVDARRQDFAAVFASVDSLFFSIEAPDPPEDVKLVIDSFEVEQVAPSSRPEPKATRGISVRRVLQGDKNVFSAMAGDQDQLLLANQRGRFFFDNDVATDLVRLDLNTGRLGRPTRNGLGVVSRVRSITLPGSDTRSLCALDLGKLDPESGLPSRRGARLVRLGGKGVTETVTADLDLPSDVVTAHYGNSRLLLVSELSTGEIYRVDESGALSLVMGCLRSPYVLAAPPLDSPWAGSFYVAEAGRLEDDEDEAVTNEGRVLEVSLGQQTWHELLSDVLVKAMAFSPGGQFGQDLLVATANLTDPSDVEAANTGQVLRITPDGKVTTLIQAIDDPYEICFTQDARCFVLASAGLFEVQASRPRKGK